MAGDTSTADALTGRAEASEEDPAGATTDPVESTATDPVEARLADALERVAHGAVVSVPSVLLEQGLALAFTATLTNGFSAAAFGVFVVARRFQAVLLSLSMGVRGGVSRFLPNAETEVERDLVATFGSALQVAVAALFGLALYLAAPGIADLTPGVTGGGADTGTFVQYLRVFAIGVPAVVWLFAVVTVMRGLEEVGALNLLQRVAFPVGQLGVAAAGVLLFDRLVVFAVGVLVGHLVRLPLVGLNQFVPPVAAALHEEGHREALSRFYHVSSRLVLVGVTALAVPAIVYRRPVMALFGPVFVEAAWLLPGFVLAQFGACAAGSVGILLQMTDNQRALLVVNTVITLFLAVVSIPLTVEFGLPGLVASYLLMLTLNNGLEVAVLYRVEGLQPFTRAHLRPLVAAVPFASVALAAQAVIEFPALAAVAGTLLGLAAYGLALRALGFEPAERRLVGTLVGRYRRAVPLG